MFWLSCPATTHKPSKRCFVVMLICLLFKLAVMLAFVVQLVCQLRTADLAHAMHKVTWACILSLHCGQSLCCMQVSNTPILGGPATVPQQQPVSTTQASVPQQPQQQLPQQVQQQPPQSAFSRFDSFGTQYDDGSASMQPQRLPSMSLGPARSIPEGAPVIFEGNIATGSHMACLEVLHRVCADLLGTLKPCMAGCYESNFLMVHMCN